MLRDKNLVPLSRQHQHALALCVRLNRAALDSPVELKAWQEEICQHFEQEIRYHFAAEETRLFPAARKYRELERLVEELLAQHSQLRHDFGQAAIGAHDRAGLLRFAETLSTHIRKEERELFEAMQQHMTAEELQAIGALVDEVLAEAPAACITPTETNLRNLRSY
jgi:hemerythrin-like domain-containing protein